MTSVQEEKKILGVSPSPDLEKQMKDVKKIIEKVGTKSEKPEDSQKLKQHIFHLEEKIAILEEEN